MFGLFKKKNKFVDVVSGGKIVNAVPDGKKEFTFVWYKKMTIGQKTHYTQPFRTTISADTRELAIQKCQDFAMRKMTLVIVEEKNFDKDELLKMQKTFDKITKQFEKMINLNK